jgi:hypothetical protein
MNDILLNVIIIIQIYSILIYFIPWIIILPIITLLSVIFVILQNDVMYALCHSGQNHSSKYHSGGCQYDPTF